LPGVDDMPAGQQKVKRHGFRSSQRGGRSGQLRNRP
jgi:hypothetical protein